MIDWLTISLALGIIAVLVGIFGFVAWQINMSDPLVSANLTGKKDDINQVLDTEKKKKDKYGNDSTKKKRKDQKKSKREITDEFQERPVVKFKEPSIQTSEETDNEREESEQESPAPQVADTSSKARKRNRNKASPTTPPPSSDQIEGILTNKGEKSPVTTRAQPIPHPKLAIITPKDEVELARQQTKTQGKSTQASNKQTVPSPTAPVKKPAPSPTNVNQGGQKQQQQQQQLLQEQQEQPFTTVVGNRHKAGTPPSQQQNKPVNITPSTTTVPTPSTQQPVPVQVPHEQLAQRQPPPRQQKETPNQLNGFNTNSLPVKQPTVVAAIPPPPTKLADLVKTLPTSQAVVTELMSALDAFPLSTDELDIIMHKIANKQSVIKQDWSKLQYGQKVDPQAHIGQVLDESARAYEEDMKTNAMKHIKELTDERTNDKRRINDLIKATNDKDLNIQVLHAQLNSFQHPQQQIQSYQVEFQRLSDENMQLKQQLAQQQHFQQQHQQLSSLNFVNTNNGDSTNAQIRVLSDQVKKLSVDNANYEKQLKSKDALMKEGQKEKDDLLRSNQQLIQKTQDNQKQFQQNEEKLRKELNEIRTLNTNQLNDYKRRIEQLELEKEQLKAQEIVQPEPVVNNEEREKLEQVIQENEQYKKNLDEIQTRSQSQENDLRQEIEQLKKNLDEIQTRSQSQENNLRQEIEQLKTTVEQEDVRNNELAAKNAQIETLRAELEEAKATNDSTNAQLDQRFRQEQERQKQFLIELLEQDIRNQLPNDDQDFDQWLSSCRQLFTSSIESSKQALQDKTVALQRENDQLHINMTEVESQLKEIERSLQSKEELLLADLTSKDAILESIRDENGQLNGEVQHLRAEINRLQSEYNNTVNDNRALKLQLDERLLVNATSPSTTTDDSFEFIKQTFSSPTENDTRAEELTQLIQSSKEALENQDSIVQQLDKHLNEMHRGGTGGISTTDVDESTVSSSTSSDQQQEQQPQT